MRRRDAKRSPESFCGIRLRTKSLLLACFAATLAAAPGKEDFPTLSPGVPVRGTISVSGARYTTYTFRVPPTAALVEIRLRGSPTDMDLYLKHGAAMGNWGTDAEVSRNSGEEEETIQIAMDGSPALRAGLYYVDVSLAASEPVAHGERWLREIPYTLELDIVEAPSPVAAVPGTPIDAVFRPGDGLYHCYRVEVSAGASALRIDVESRRDDLDLYIRSGSDFIPRRDAHHIATSRRSREAVI
ncbi:MAG: PPC domain-containing protein, partial [Planctomycetes bacterium]|nr:PPC domain-containing protein [Planctomycetota bacterium]